MKSKFITTFVMGLLLVGSALAVDSGGNSVYIDQTNSATGTSVTITQTGSNNIIGDQVGGSAGFAIDGDALNLTMTQDGVGNAIYGNFVGTGSTGSITQTGNSNTTTLTYGNMGTGEGQLTVGITGDNNATSLNIGAGHNSSNYIYNLAITGSSNTVSSTIDSKNTRNNITVAGDSNTITTEQRGANGTTLAGGHSLTISNIGSNNSITTLQNGVTTPNAATINVTGNNATVSVTQH